MLLKVQATRYVDDSFPGWVECEFVDAENGKHIFVEKVPRVSEEWFGPETIYPQDAVIDSELLEHWSDSSGRELVRVAIDPMRFETKEEGAAFVVLASQVISAEEEIAGLKAAAERKKEKR